MFAFQQNHFGGKEEDELEGNKPRRDVIRRLLTVL